MQGFPADMIRPQASGVDFSRRQLVDLAGNAFNGGVCSAVLTAGFGVYPWLKGSIEEKDIGDASGLVEEAEDDSEVEPGK